MAKYMFETVNEIKKCSECPLCDDSLKCCLLYSVGIPARYGYKEFDTGKPDWCELQRMVPKGGGLYETYESLDKEISKRVMEACLRASLKSSEK